jgi:hypothetical protein
VAERREGVDDPRDRRPRWGHSVPVSSQVPREEGRRCRRTHHRGFGAAMKEFLPGFGIPSISCFVGRAHEAARGGAACGLWDSGAEIACGGAGCEALRWPGGFGSRNAGGSWIGLAKVCAPSPRPSPNGWERVPDRGGEGPVAGRKVIESAAADGRGTRVLECGASPSAGAAALCRSQRARQATGESLAQPAKAEGLGRRR